MLFSEKRPIKCEAGNYCLRGVGTKNITKLVDVWSLKSSFSQVECEKGIFCEEGAKNAFGNGLCEEGSFCAGGSVSGVKAEPGYYVPRKGFSTQLGCKKSSFSSISGAVKCLTCPIGFECPDDIM